MIHKDTFFPVSIFFSQFGGIRDVAKILGLETKLPSNWPDWMKVIAKVLTALP